MMRLMEKTMQEPTTALPPSQREAADYIDDMAGQLADLADANGLKGQAALLRAFRLAWPTDFARRQ